LDKKVQPETAIAGNLEVGLERRNFLKCRAWGGTGIVWAVSAGGLLSACGDLTDTPTPKTEGFTFVQLSDSHIGFNTEGVNTDVVGTLKQSVDRINALPQRPALVLHTGDISHNSKPEEFDQASQIMNTIKTEKVFYVPGEHDLVNDKGAGYRQRFLAANSTKSWYSMDYKGVHFIALSNSGELDQFGSLGATQIDWLTKDLQAVKKDTPIVVFAHVPLYSVYPAWGWETKDASPVLTLLMSYSAVTILNGHIHQVLSKVEGNIHFYTANATAFPQHRPGIEKPNAYKLPASELLQSIGYRTVTIVPTKAAADIADTTLSGAPASVVTVGAFPTPVPTTQALVAQTDNAPIDAGAITDFSETTPRQLTLKFSDKPAMIFVLKAGSQFLALSDICTHMGCEVGCDQPTNRFLCPCHGSEYDLTGKNVAGPAPRPLDKLKTEVVNGRLLISAQRVA